MIKLLLSAIGLSATDCMDPVTLSVALYLLTTGRPILNLLFFITGIVLVTFASGLFLTFGLIRELDTLFSHPQGLYFAFQLLVGVALGYAGYRYFKHAASSEVVADSPIKFEVNPVAAFVIGILFTTTDLPTNVPLLGLADVLVKSNASFLTVALSCLAYALVRVSPSLFLLGAFMVKKEASQSIIERVKGPIIKWGHRLMAVIIFLMGLVLVLDSVYYFVTDRVLLVI
ncbi:MAG: GAP family protein [Candidatus Obscuribacterales bacterium]